METIREHQINHPWEKQAGKVQSKINGEYLISKTFFMLTIILSDYHAKQI